MTNVHARGKKNTIPLQMLNQKTLLLVKIFFTPNSHYFQGHMYSEKKIYKFQFLFFIFFSIEKNNPDLERQAIFVVEFLFIVFVKKFKRVPVYCTFLRLKKHVSIESSEKNGNTLTCKKRRE